MCNFDLANTVTFTGLNISMNLTCTAIMLHKSHKRTDNMDISPGPVWTCGDKLC